MRYALPFLYVLVTHNIDRLTDTCMTSIFSSSWMCRLCGREACSECFAQVRELTINPPGADQKDILALQQRREKHAHSNPFFLSCTRRSEHQAKDFSPMSRFCKAELEQAIVDMQELLKASRQRSRGDHDQTEGTQPHNSPCMDNETDLTTAYNIPGYIPPCDANSPLSHHPIRRFIDKELTEKVFQRVWKEGEPLVVMDVLHKFRIKWTPEYFVQKYGTQSCLIIECQTDANKRITVSEFFGWFGRYENRTEVWKLKVH